jgi:23S rRNA pseudouridine2605 synthase
MVRLNKYLAEKVGLSRREADEIIGKGLVFVNDKPARLGQQIEPSDKVVYRGVEISGAAQYIYIMVNKPEGYVCSRKRQGKAPTIYEILPEEYQGLKTVGRLDKDSCGLILMTNDGDFAFRMTHPKFRKEKVYQVKLDRALSKKDLAKINRGVKLKDGVSRMTVERNGEYYKVTMSEGKNRQIRRTFQAVGHNVVFLKRVKFGDYKLDKLAEGKIIRI